MDFRFSVNEVSSLNHPEVVSEVEAREHIRVPGDEVDVLAAIAAATAFAEDYTRRSLRRKTFRLNCDYFPYFGGISLPFPPLLSVDSIMYRDTSEAMQTLDSSTYFVDTFSTPGRVLLADGQQWPDVSPNPNAVLISYSAGYGHLAPVAIKQAILLMIGHFYENREAVIVGQQVNAIPMGVKSLLGPYCVAVGG